ncbi:NINE protein [Brevundimonas fontaquae]|uniref:NINE protein n=1 Tax=Brevundimonas fontaquae TaxID=2813778 RepID=A0ABX7LVN1_9CAUL|nr:NINE protein [Brevundimonas fontaquae]QSF54598.1 NINE protein [Brevundimonas fontaquae]
MSNQSGLSADTQALMAFEANKKSAGVAYLLWFFTGSVGGHRFYLGRTGSAVAQLTLCLTGILLALVIVGFFLIGVLAVWLLIDLFTIGGMVEEQNRKLMDRLNVGAKPQESVVDELAKFATLRDSGAISQDEYEAQKRRLIGAPV